MSAIRSVEIPARPAPLTIDPATTAVIVVDMQNDFGAEGGMFHRAGIDIGPIRAIVPAVSRTLEAARAAGCTIVYLKMEFSPDLSDLGGAGTPTAIKHEFLHLGDRVAAPDGSDGRILIRGTWNTAIIDQLTPEPDDLIVSKQRYSGFYNTDLDALLRAANITTLIFTGATTSVCVESTLRDAMFRDYACLLLADCVSEPIGFDTPRSNHDASLLVVELLFGWVTESAALIDAIATEKASA